MTFFLTFRYDLKLRLHIDVKTVFQSEKLRSTENCFIVYGNRSGFTKHSKKQVFVDLKPF